MLKNPITIYDGKYCIGSRQLSPPIVVEVLLTNDEGGEWLKVVLLDPPDRAHHPGFVRVGVQLEGDASLIGDIPLKATFRLPTALPRKDKT